MTTPTDPRAGQPGPADSTVALASLCGTAAGDLLPPPGAPLPAAPPIKPPATWQPDPAAGDAGPPFEPRGVIGQDDRRQVPDPSAQPWCRICHLVMQDAQGRRFGGTGWLAGPSTVFTAGHNLLLPSRDHAAAQVWVGDSSRPGSDYLLATTLDVHPQWRASEDPGHDVGMLWLPQPLGKRLGWFGFAPQAPQVLQGLQMRISGYPGDKPTATQWFHDGPVDQVGQTLLAYRIDTKPGQSGSPAFVADAQGNPIAVAVHAYDDDQQNLGVRITPALFDVLKTWWR